MVLLFNFKSFANLVAMNSYLIMVLSCTSRVNNEIRYLVWFFPKLLTQPSTYTFLDCRINSFYLWNFLSTPQLSTSWGNLHLQKCLIPKHCTWVDHVHPCLRPHHSCVARITLFAWNIVLNIFHSVWFVELCSSFSLSLLFCCLPPLYFSSLPLLAIASW